MESRSGDQSALSPEFHCSEALRSECIIHMIAQQSLSDSGESVFYSSPPNS